MFKIEKTGLNKFTVSCYENDTFVYSVANISREEVKTFLQGRDIEKFNVEDFEIDVYTGLAN